MKNIKGEKFIFTLKNTTGGALIVALLAAFFDTAVAGSLAKTNAAEIVKAGYPCDYVVDDGIIVDGAVAGHDLVCTPIDPSKTYRAFREYIKNNERRIKAITIQSNNLAAFNKTMRLIDCNPLGSDVVVSIPLVALRDGASNLNDVVEMSDDSTTFGYDTLVLLPIEEGHELTVSLWFE